MKAIKKVCLAGFLVSCFVPLSFANTVKDLSDWSGKWVSVIDVMNKPEINKELTNTYIELGKKEGISGEEWRDKKMKSWDSSEIKSMEITSNTIKIFLKNGSKVENTYQYKGEINIPYKEGKSLNWYTFESNNNNTYKYMAFRPSGKNENLSHFHFRNSDQSFNQLTKETIFKTVVSPNTTASQLAGDFME